MEHNEEKMENLPKIPEHGKNKKLSIILISMAVLVLVGIAGIAIYWNSMLNLIGDPAEATVATLSEEEQQALLGTTEPTETTPEDTWPQVVSDEVITNIMLVGQNFRPDEQNKLSDTMILCSINRETKTLTMISFLRDLFVPLPAYAGHGPGGNRINVCYALGSTWKRSSEGGMEMLALCVEQNFGIPVHHTIEVSFDTFTSIIDALGGVEIDVTEKEAEYMTNHVGYVYDMYPGYQTLNGYQALAYARIRAIDGDVQRTARQRAVITSLLDKCRDMGLMDIHEMATNVLPMIITDMSNQEITNYLWEFLPMLKDLKIQSITCPVPNDVLPNSMWGKVIELYGYQSSVIKCDIPRNGAYLRQMLGMTSAEK